MADSDQTLQRVHYFTGQLLGAEDFQAEQDYCRERLRRHNRLLHGYGVVFGLQVEQVGQQQIVVHPGAVLDCQGNELVLAEPLLCQLPETGKRVYVCLMYAEWLADPVPRQGPSSEGADMFYTRVVEGVQVDLLPNNPTRQHQADRVLPGCDEPHPVALARIVRKRAGWKLDTTFRQQQAYPPKTSRKGGRSRKNTA